MRYLILIASFFLFGNVYSTDFQPFGTNGAIVINRGAELFEKPDIKSTKILNLSYLQYVSVFKMNSNSNQIWYYIDSYSSTNHRPPTLKGWVNRIDLAGKSDFKPVRKMPEMFIIAYTIDGPEVNYHIYPDGTYEIWTKAETYNMDKSILKGKVIQCKNVLMMGDTGDLFYYDEEGQLKSPFTEIKVITNKSKFPKIKEPTTQSKTLVLTLTGDNVNVRAEASTNSAALVKLSKGAKVTLLKRSDIALTVGDKKGFWAYIDTGIKDKKGGTIKGWVFDYYLKKAE